MFQKSTKGKVDQLKIEELSDRPGEVHELSGRGQWTVGSFDRYGEPIKWFIIFFSSLPVREESKNVTLVVALPDSQDPLQFFVFEICSGRAPICKVEIFSNHDINLKLSHIMRHSCPGRPRSSALSKPAFHSHLAGSSHKSLKLLEVSTYGSESEYQILPKTYA